MLLHEVAVVVALLKKQILIFQTLIRGELLVSCFIQQILKIRGREHKQILFSKYDSANIIQLWESKNLFHLIVCLNGYYNTFLVL